MSVPVVGMVEETVIGAVKRYLAGLPALGIHASKAVLFGSFAQGQANEWSDIARQEGIIIPA